MTPNSYDGDSFTDSAFNVFCNRVANCVFALMMIAARCEPIHWTAPLWKYMAISLSNVLASMCQYEALKYVIFPVQMLGKSFKMMPVMIWGIIISGKKYGVIDWLIAAMVTFGVTEFLLTGPITHDDGPEASSLKGLLLIIGFLAFDGFTSTYQEHLFREYTVSKYNQILYINAASILTSSSILTVSGGFARSIEFAHRHPSYIVNVSMLSTAAASSQWFIYSQIQEFGALVFAATMNVRQLVSIIASYVKFGHSITPLQVLGLALVFGALFVKSYIGLTAKKEPTNKEGLERGDREHSATSGADMEKGTASEKAPLTSAAPAESPRVEAIEEAAEE